MARTAFYGPAHRVMNRLFPGASQSADAAPSLDMGGSGIQDSRLPWNTANSATGAQVIGWPGNLHPVIDFVPATLGVVSIAAGQVPVAGTKLVLVSSTGAGIVVSSSALLCFPSLNTIPAGSLFVDVAMVYQRFGSANFTLFYDAATMVGRNIAIHSAGDDHLATATVVGWDCYGYVMHETITLGNNATVNGKKAFKAIASITPAGTLSGSNVNVGVGDSYGLPLYGGSTVPFFGFWNNLITTGTGTYTAGVTTTASATTGDVRGTFLPASASDGTKRMTLFQHPVISAMASSGINVGLFGVPQF